MAKKPTVLPNTFCILCNFMDRSYKKHKIKVGQESFLAMPLVKDKKEDLCQIFLKSKKNCLTFLKSNYVKFYLIILDAVIYIESNILFRAPLKLKTVNITIHINRYKVLRQGKAAFVKDRNIYKSCLKNWRSL